LYVYQAGYILPGKLKKIKTIPNMTIFQNAWDVNHPQNAQMVGLLLLAFPQ